MKKLYFLLFAMISLASFAAEKSDNGSEPEKASLQQYPHPFMALQTDPSTPEQIKERMRRAIDMQNEHTRARLKSFSEPEMVESFAQFSRSYYEALINVGFSKEEALQIVINVGFPDFR